MKSTCSISNLLYMFDIVGLEWGRRANEFEFLCTSQCMVSVMAYGKNKCIPSLEGYVHSLDIYVKGEAPEIKEFGKTVRSLAKEEDKYFHIIGEYRVMGTLIRKKLWNLGGNPRAAAYDLKKTITLIKKSFDITKHGYKTEEGTTLTSIKDLRIHENMIYDHVHQSIGEEEAKKDKDASNSLSSFRICIPISEG